ncbi:MAG: DUF2490 domain-containing protein [Bacteroidota bacterium]
MKKKTLVALLFLIPSLFLKAQSANEQAWFEYMLNLPFANSFNLENAFTYSTLAGTPKWRAYDYSATVEWSVNQNIDLIAQSVFSYTNQTETYNTFEIRPVIGTRFYFTPNKRIQTRLLLRLEQRNFKNLETKEWDQVQRPRARGEVIIPINKDSYYEDKLWYAITDVEWFFKIEDVKERFANRFRWRIGAGYRLSYSVRFEFLYMLQQSRDAIDGDFETSDNIFRFRLKHYLRKSKPSKASGTGN